MSMASAAGTPAAGTFRIGNVFARALGLLSRHFVLFFLVVAAENVALLIITPQMWLWSGRLYPPRPVSTTDELVSFVFWFILLPLTQTIIYHAAFQAMLGRPIRFGSSFAIALRRFFPVLGTFICMGAVIGVGFALLLVPGVIWATMFAIAAPTCVVERLGPFRSLGRSRVLTQGNRWKILAIGLLLFLMTVVVWGAVVVTTFKVGPMFGTLVRFLLNSILGAFYSVVGVVIYHDLRASREGVTTDRIAAVFD